ncbi:MAG: hypothetical protein ACRDZ4_10475 [Egibacteraceae bacterium]
MPAATSSALTVTRLLMQAARRAPGWSTVLVLATVVGAVAGLLFPAALGAAVDAVLGRAEPGPALTRFAAVVAATPCSAGCLEGRPLRFTGHRRLLGCDIGC